MLDYVLERGTHVADLAPSTYETMLAIWLTAGYPVGSVLPLGVTRLVDVDPAWTWQPYLAFLGALLALVLYELVGGAVRARWLRALVAVTASSSALLYGYALWGGVKEVYAAVLLALLAATASLSWKGRRRAALVPAVAAAAFLDGLSVAATIWLVPLILVVVFGAWRRRTLTTAVFAALASLALALPALVVAPEFLDDANEVARGTDVTGNLLGPLSPWQLAGIWPSEDFRVAPEESRATDRPRRRRPRCLRPRSGRCVSSTCLATARASRDLGGRRPRLPGLFRALDRGEGTSPPPRPPSLRSRSSAARRSSSQGAGSKARLCSPRSSAASRGRTRSRSSDARLAPRGQLAELEAIGARHAGEGPALMTEYQPYGVRHFLRRLDAEGASELRRRPVLLREGRMLGKGETAPIDAFLPEALLVYRTLVLLRSGPGGIPPSPFTLVERGRYYDVWQQPR